MQWLWTGWRRLLLILSFNITFYLSLAWVCARLLFISIDDMRIWRCCASVNIVQNVRIGFSSPTFLHPCSVRCILMFTLFAVECTHAPFASSACAIWENVCFAPFRCSPSTVPFRSACVASTFDDNGSGLNVFPLMDLKVERSPCWMSNAALLLISWTEMRFFVCQWPHL